MITQKEITKIKELVLELLQKMTLDVFSVEATANNAQQIESSESKNVVADGVIIDIKLNDPQMLIGQNGQTLFELQRVLKILLNKKLGKYFYLTLDINDYKKNKIDYLKKIAQDAANEVALTKIKKTLPPMNSYERLIVHKELAARQDIVTQSQGEGTERLIIISAK